MDRIIRERELRAILGGISRTTLWEWRRLGLFPEPIILGAGLRGWRESAITEWLETRPAAGTANAHTE